MKIKPLAERSPDSCTYHDEQQGLAIGVHPVTDRHEVKEIFRTDLRSIGVLPILVVAENRNSSASYVLAKDNVSVLDESTGIASALQRSKVASETPGSATATAGAAMLAVAPVAAAPLLIAGMKMASNATVIQHNLGDKEFYTCTLGPGQSAQGFIYFQHPKDALPAGVYHVLVNVRDSATGGLIPFDFEVTLTP